MDIAIVGTKSLKVKSKNTSFIINPEKKFDEDVIVLMSKPDDYEVYGEKLVIYGPGDYETAGVSVKGEAYGEGISYEFFEEGQKLVVLSSPKVVATKDIAEANAVVAFLDEESRDEISQITCDTVVVIGEESHLSQDRTSVKKIDKISLKKTEEYKGFTIHLSK